MFMAKAKTKSKKAEELDSVYLLKMVLYLILGSFWLKFDKSGSYQIPIPLGLLVGAFLASHERFQIDRKMEYAILLMAMFIGFWLPLGLTIAL